jgi:serine/threonine-protein kinase
MGSVYVAHDPVLGRMVAIKVFGGDLDLPDARDRFAREARAAAAFNHPNIVTVYDFGEYDAQPFIVMEYVAGETLATLIRRKAPVTLGDKVRWMEELCAGAGYAHQMHLVHRDIKPANLMIDRSGRLKILDFGIARILGLATNTSMMIGTPGYMAPEQIVGDHVDHRADQFSIGIVFYELLAYTEAFPGDTLPMITHRILNEEPAPLAQAAPDAPPELIAIVHRALRKRPADRFPDSESLRSAVSRVRRNVSNQASNFNTIGITRETPSPSVGTRGTGSARRRQDDAVGVAQLTPTPDSRRTDREALARRRTMQLEAALKEARAFFAKGELELALDSCQQALTFDENHVEALILEEQIEAAFRRDSIPAQPTPEPFSTRAETLWPDLGRSSRSGTSLDDVAPMGVPMGAPTAPPAGAEPTVLRPPAVPIEATVIAPPRKTPAPSPGVARTTPGAPASEPAAKPAVAKEARPSAGATAPSRITAGSRAIVDAANSVVVAVPRNGRVLSIVVGSVAIVVAAVVALTMMQTGPAPTGSLVIDAVPWASITSIQTEDGEPVTLPQGASTPFAMSLPAGSYQVAVTGPPPESQRQTLTVQVEPSASTVAPLIRFRTVTPEEYFEEYLAAPTASLEEDAPPPTPPPARPSQSPPGGAAPVVNP